MSDSVHFAVDDGIAVVTINRPEARNAIDLPTAESIAACMDEIDDNDDIRVAIITGAGGTFCAGMDLKSFSRGERPVLPGRGFAGLVQAPPEKPLIAAVEGFAVGGGFEIVLACDLVTAGADARFALPEVKRGLLPAAGGLFRLGQRIPQQKAVELVLTGDVVGAEEGGRLGFVNSVTEPGHALERAQELAAKIAANAPWAVRVAKQVMNASRSWRDQDSFALQEPTVRPVMQSEDGREGARAFAEKRTPVWTGR